MLESLGGVSRFLLRAIDHQFSLDALIQITGLSESVLLQQLAFLESHRYIEKVQVGDEPVINVTDRGASMVRVEGLLRDFAPVVWLDAFTLRLHAVHLALRDDSHEVASRIEPGVVKVRVPRRRKGRTGRYQLFDEASRLRILLDQGALVSVLEHYWGKDCALIHSESEHWECKLQSPEGEVSTYFAARFNAGELELATSLGKGESKPPTVPQVSLPVLQLRQVFKPLQDFPWAVPVPPAEIRQLELISHQVLPPSLEITLADAEASDFSVISCALEEQLPDLPPFEVPYGMASEINAVSIEAAFIMDEQLLALKMQSCNGVTMLSHNVDGNVVVDRP